MLEKKITRKEFLLTALSIGAVLVASKIPSTVKNLAAAKRTNTYGNNSYGGGQKNV